MPQRTIERHVDDYVRTGKPWTDFLEFCSAEDSYEEGYTTLSQDDCERVWNKALNDKRVSPDNDIVSVGVRLAHKESEKRSANL